MEKFWILKTLSDSNIENPLLSSFSDAGGASARRRRLLLPPLMLPLSLSSVFGSFTVVLHLSLPVRGSPSYVTAMVSSHCGKLSGTALSTRDSWEALHSLQFTTFHPATFFQGVPSLYASDLRSVSLLTKVLCGDCFTGLFPPNSALSGGFLFMLCSAIPSTALLLYQSHGSAPHCCVPSDLLRPNPIHHHLSPA